MKTHLEYKDSKSHKFWSIEVKGAGHTVTFGRVGTAGQTKAKEFNSAADAKKDAERLVASKVKKGYAKKKSSTKKAAKKATTKKATKKATTKKATKKATKKTARKATKKAAKRATTKTARKATKKAAKKATTKATTKATKRKDLWMTEEAEKRLRKMGCWDSVTTRGFSALVSVAWKLGEDGDNSSAVAVYLRILTSPVPEKGAARNHYLLAANNACNGAMRVDDGLAAKIADLVSPVGHDNPRIFYNTACAYARVGKKKKALSQVKLAIKHNYSGLQKMLNDSSLDVLMSLPEFKKLRAAQLVPEVLLKCFKPHEPPKELVALLPFDDMFSEHYSRCFMLTLTKPHYWSKKKAFKDRIFIFATTGSGTDYALWMPEASTKAKDNLSDVPVVVFGGEGGTHVIANNLKDFLRLLTVDSEVSVDWDEAYFYQGEEDRSEDRDKYVTWLKDQYGLTPVKKPDTLTKAAQKKWAKKYQTWVKPFLP